MTFDWTYAVRILPDLLSASIVTVLCTVGGMLLAMTLGLAVAVTRLSAPHLVERAAFWCMEFIRCTPILVQIYAAYYILPLYGIKFGAISTGILVLGVHYATYLSEIYRAGIEALPEAQWESARVLGLPRRTTWLRVIIPQAIPPMVPAIGNYWIGMLKSTPYLAFITVPELMGEALSQGGQSYRYLEPLLLVGAILLAISYPASIIVRRISNRTTRHQSVLEGSLA